MLTKKEQRLRRARQTRVRIAQQGVRTSDGQSYQPAYLYQRHFRRRWKVLASASTAERPKSARPWVAQAKVAMLPQPS